MGGITVGVRVSVVSVRYMVRVCCGLQLAVSWLWARLDFIDIGLYLCFAISTSALWLKGCHKYHAASVSLVGLNLVKC